MLVIILFILGGCAPSMLSLQFVISAMHVCGSACISAAPPGRCARCGMEGRERKRAKKKEEKRAWSGSNMATRAVEDDCVPAGGCAFDSNVSGVETGVFCLYALYVPTGILGREVGASLLKSVPVSLIGNSACWAATVCCSMGPLAPDAL